MVRVLVQMRWVYAGCAELECIASNTKKALEKKKFKLKVKSEVI
jgi:hypothetical protein